MNDDGAASELCSGAAPFAFSYGLSSKRSAHSPEEEPDLLPASTGRIG